MLKYLSIYGAAALSVISFEIAYAAGQSCDINYQNDVEWTALNETVTLQHHVTKDETGAAQHKASLVFSDGHKMSLPMGTMCLGELGCRDMALMLHKALKTSFTDGISYYGHKISTLGDFTALLTDEAFCAQIKTPYAQDYYAGEDGEARLTQIKQSTAWQSDFTQCNLVLENIAFADGRVDGMTKERFWHLAAQNAPIISIP